MSKRSGGRTKRHLQSVPTGADAGGPQHGDSAAPGPNAFLDGLEQVLEFGAPLDFLIDVSGIVEASLHRDDVFAPPTPDAPTVENLVEVLSATPVRATTAMLTAVRALVPDDVLGARIGRELTRRSDPLPGWLRELDAARVTSEVIRIGHDYGDADDYVFTVELAGGDELTAVVLIDHIDGSAVRDAFVVPASHRDVLSRVTGDSVPGRVPSSLRPTDPAQARATIEYGIEMGSQVVPPFESETWPIQRPLVEWMVRVLPGGAVVEEEWDDAAIDGLITAFFDSPYGVDVDPDLRHVFDALLWMHPSDPDHWSPAVVEVMVDRFTRKVSADPADMAELPDLLRAFVQFCGVQRGLSAREIAGTLAEIDELEPGYFITIGFDPGAFYYLRRKRAIRRAVGAQQVGGADKLATLDAAPLPDEDLDLAAVPGDIVCVVLDVAKRCDDCADALFDVEMRTAMRRFLARVAALDPQIFRRRASVDRTAAAVAWAVGRANGVIGAAHGLTHRDFLGWFGVTGSVSVRGEQMIRAVGVPNPVVEPGVAVLGSPDLLTSKVRAEIIEARDGSGSVSE